MPLEFKYEANDICELRISRVLKRNEFAAAQADLARKIDAGAKPRVLVIGENFEGWERGADWNDLDFLFSHRGEIVRIAVVADPRWEVHALAFCGRRSLTRGGKSSFLRTNWRKREPGWRNRDSAGKICEAVSKIVAVSPRELRTKSGVLSEKWASEWLLVGF